MKVLFLAPRLMLPADTGGKIRTYNLIKQIARFAEVHLVCFSFEKGDVTHLVPLEKLGITSALIPAAEPSVLKKISGVLGAIPYSVAKYHSEEMRRAVRTLMKQYSFDLVYIDHIHMAHYQDCFTGLPCVVDEHNVEYKILERCGNVEKAGWKQHLYFQQAAKMKRFEKQVIPIYSACTAVSADDADILKDLTGGSVPVHVLPNGVDTEFFTPVSAGAPSGEEDDALVFTGSMDWLPNEDAVLYFMKEILPLVWQKNPNVKFYIVGKSPAPAILQARGNEERIVVTGRVDDVRPFMAKSKIFVVPLRIGGGTRLKILEALAMEKAIVSTSIGAEGISCEDGRDIVIADRPQEFAGKILSLLTDREKRVNLGKAGRRLVLEQYDWSIMGQKLKSIFKELLHGKEK